MTVEERSMEPITTEDLRCLLRIARLDREEFFARNPKYRTLEDRVVATCLCQGAALHYVDGRNGVKDFDVWTFYRPRPDITYPPRRRGERDFGDPKFGQTPDRPDLVGRKVDLMGRSLDAEAKEPMDALRNYLSSKRTTAAKQLAHKAVVLLEPQSQLGKVVWSGE